MKNIPPEFSPPSIRFFCEFCCKTTLFSQEIPSDLHAQHRLFAVLEGRAVLVGGEKEIFLSEGSFAFFEGDKITIDETRSDGSLFFLSFDGTLSPLLHELKLSSAAAYEMSPEQLELFERIRTEYQSGIETGASFLFTARLFEIFTLAARSLYNRILPASAVGINGFSMWGIAEREEGVFHGRKAIKITPNRSVKSIIVLENHLLEIYHINPLHYRFVQMHYYYESRGTHPLEARLRTLSVLDEDDPERKTVFIDKNGDHPFFAPLRRNRWSNTFFTLHYPPELHAVLEKMSRPVLQQIKIDPFGVIDAPAIDEGDVMYISSVTFYSDIDKNRLPDLSPIESARLLIDETYRRELPLSFYAEACHFSLRHFVTRFTHEIGISPHQYIIQKRIEYARAYLDSNDKRIADIAAEAGFPDPHYFSRIFKKHTGLSPAQYRKIARETTASLREK